MVMLLHGFAAEALMAKELVVEEEVVVTAVGEVPIAASVAVLSLTLSF